MKKYNSVSSGVVRAKQAVKTKKNVEHDAAAIVKLLAKSQKQTPCFRSLFLSSSLDINRFGLTA